MTIKTDLLVCQLIISMLGMKTHSYTHASRIVQQDIHPAAGQTVLLATWIPL